MPVVLLVGGAAMACAGQSSSVPEASDPAAAVRGFLAAVKANDLAAMGRQWGTGDKGPAAGWEDAETLRKRLVVIQSYLVHEQSEILADNEPAVTGTLRILRVRLSRRGCEPVVPFTVTRYREGWLVQAVDLEAAGNPARSCR